jgi:hypothetical protein
VNERLSGDNPVVVAFCLQLTPRRASRVLCARISACGTMLSAIALSS